MPCSQLHMVEVPDPDPYSDSELKDLVGEYPASTVLLYAAQSASPRRERAVP